VLGQQFFQVFPAVARDSLVEQRLEAHLGRGALGQGLGDLAQLQQRKRLQRTGARDFVIGVLKVVGRGRQAARRQQFDGFAGDFLWGRGGHGCKAMRAARVGATV
jgi:hypothetical protein